MKQAIKILVVSALVAGVLVLVGQLPAITDQTPLGFDPGELLSIKI